LTKPISLDNAEGKEAMPMRTKIKLARKTRKTTTLRFNYLTKGFSSKFCLKILFEISECKNIIAEPKELIRINQMGNTREK